MNNLIVFPGITHSKQNQGYIPKTDLRELEISIRDPEVDEALYWLSKKLSITRADEIEKLKDAARTKASKKDTLMELHLEMMRSDPVYRNKVLTEVHQMICLNALSIRKS